MNSTTRRIGEQALIVFNIFIGFLLIFADKLVLPFWLQPAGRLHTLMLHFPIVILILAVVMEIFRFSANNKTNSFYTNTSRSLLLGGTLLAGITVIMGIFLSTEEGYEGDTLQWHKWTGGALFFIASIIYWLGNTKWFGKSVAVVCALVITGALIITGHYGATLTHGENFILQPIAASLTKPPVPLEEAVIFADVIQPILDKKMYELS